MPPEIAISTHAAAGAGAAALRCGALLPAAEPGQVEEVGGRPAARQAPRRGRGGRGGPGQAAAHRRRPVRRLPPALRPTPLSPALHRGATHSHTALSRALSTWRASFQCPRLRAAPPTSIPSVFGAERASAWRGQAGDCGGVWLHCAARGSEQRPAGGGQAAAGGVSPCHSLSFRRVFARHPPPLPRFCVHRVTLSCGRWARRG